MNSSPSLPILIVDDEASVRLSLELALVSSGLTNTVQCADSSRVLDALEAAGASLILLDLVMPGKSGQSLLAEIKARSPETPVVVVTGTTEVDTAVECMKKGAFDYLLKPVSEEKLIEVAKKAVEMSELLHENEAMKTSMLSGGLKDPSAFDGILGGDPKMKGLFQYCEAIAGSSQPVLIVGETGTGKELFARAIHRLSGRKGQFVPVNIAGLDSNVLSDTLFGHAKGAFTGAGAVRKGMIESAAGGTLFLDEIGDLSEESQVKLLRLLQEREYTPLGSDVIKLSDARILVATNSDLKAKIASGQFRKDLFFRLKTHQICLPPLRERPGDIKLLLNHFLNAAAKELGKGVPSFPKELVSALKVHPFPGNVRELRAMAYDAMSGHGGGMLSIKDFKLPDCRDGEGGRESLEFEELLSKITELPTIKESVDCLVREALRRADSNQTIAGSLVGISQQALSHRCKKLKLQD